MEDISFLERDELFSDDSTIQKKYGTFNFKEIGMFTTHMFEKCFIGCYSLTVIMIILFINFGLDITGVIIAINNSNTTCDDNFQKIQLSQWLLIFSIIDCFISGFYILLAACLETNLKTRKNTACKFIGLLIQLMYAILTLVMVISGIIELVHVFSLCIKDAYALSVMSVIVIVFKILSFCPLFGYLIYQR